MLISIYYIKHIRLMVADVGLWFIAPVDWDRKLCILYISVCVLLCGEPKERISPTWRCWSPDSTGTDGECVKWEVDTSTVFKTIYADTSTSFHSEVCKLESKPSLCALGLIWDVQSVRISPGSGFRKMWISLLKNSRAGKQEIAHNRYCVHRYMTFAAFKSYKFLFMSSEVTVCCVISSRDSDWKFFF